MWESIKTLAYMCVTMLCAFTRYDVATTITSTILSFSRLINVHICLPRKPCSRGRSNEKRRLRHAWPSRKWACPNKMSAPGTPNWTGGNITGKWRPTDRGRGTCSPRWKVSSRESSDHKCYPRLMSPQQQRRRGWSVWNAAFRSETTTTEDDKRRRNVKGTG